MIDFEPLAGGSKGNAYLVSDGYTPLLLEAGLRIKEIRKRLKFGLSSVEGCLVSHEHADHASGVRDLIKAGIDIYASQGTIDALSLTGHRLNIIEAKQQFEIGTWRIMPFRVIHDAAEPLGFLLADQDNDKLLFATDTHYIPNCFKGLTHIAVECNFEAGILKENIESGLVHPDVGKGLWGRHMSLETVRRFLDANDLSQVQEIHLLHLSSQNSDARKFQAEIEKQTGKPVYIAE